MRERRAAFARWRRLGGAAAVVSHLTCLRLTNWVERSRRESSSAWAWSREAWSCAVASCASCSSRNRVSCPVLGCSGGGSLYNPGDADLVAIHEFSQAPMKMALGAMLWPLLGGFTTAVGVFAFLNRLSILAR